MPLPAPGPEPAGLPRQALAPPDARLADRARHDDGLAFALVMRRHNRRLFRVARGLVWSDAEAEDVLQESYVRAYARLGDLAGDRALAAWLARIVANEAPGRRRSAARVVSLEEHRARIRVGDDGGGDTTIARDPASDRLDPERLAANGELRRLLEAAVDALRLIAGFVVWSVAFALLSIGCEPGWDSVIVGPVTLQRSVLVLVWMVQPRRPRADAALGASRRRPLGRGRRARPFHGDRVRESDRHVPRRHDLERRPVLFLSTCV